MSQQWNYPGARWWKFDFHSHTPASKDTTAWNKAAGTEDEITPEKWLLKFMKAGIDCVAVTDLNTGAWVDRLKAAYAEMEKSEQNGSPVEGFRRLYIFPGVEISVLPGIHVLAIFDPSESTASIERLLGKVKCDSRADTIEVMAQEGITEIFRVIQEMGGVVIPAHVDDEKGLLQVESGRTKFKHGVPTIKQVLKEPGLLALEWKERESESFDLFRGLNKELKLSFSSVIGSDCHNFKFGGIPGSNFTWIKMSIPNIEGLRLALLDGQGSSVLRKDEADEKFSPWQVPKSFVESIEIKDARFMGRGNQSAILKFHPYFSALIGGRGTGKSTVVHALRLAYQRGDELQEGSEAGITFQQFCKPIRGRNSEGGLTDNTAITVLVQKDHVRYRVTWRQGGQDLGIERQDEMTGEFLAVDRHVSPRDYFQIQIFSQGQIASLSGNNQFALLKIIDDAAGTLSLKREFDEVRSAFFATQAQKRELTGRLKIYPQLQLQLTDVQHKLDQFEKTDHATILKNFQRISRQNKELKRQYDAIQGQALSVKEFAASLISEDLPEGLFDEVRDEAEIELVADLHKKLKTVKDEIDNLGQRLREYGQEFVSDLKAIQWEKKVNTAKLAYDQLKEDLQRQGVNDPALYGRLIQEKLRLEAELRQLNELNKRLDCLKNQSVEQQHRLQLIRREITQKREYFLKNTLEENPYVRIEVIPYGVEVKELERSIRELLEVDEKKYTDAIYRELESGECRGLVAELLNKRNGNDFISADVYEKKLMQKKKELEDACHGVDKFGTWFNQYLVNAAEKKPEFIDRILSWFPEDGLQVEYSRKGDGKNFQSIRQASAGQRAAAMLAFLLAYGNEPLVLDQPEDDLDNHLIYDLVVQQIRSNKLRRQLIVVTHNPNIVVNGDAELIYVLDYNHQCYVKNSGALQESEIRREVCLVMEGGKEAFEQRYQRLGKNI